MKKLTVDNLRIEIYENRPEMGKAAAEAVAAKIRTGLQTKGSLRMIFAAAPSQNEFLQSLRQMPDIDWTRIVAFHMDEYLGLSQNAPQGFGRFLKERLFDLVPFKTVYYLNRQPADAEAECKRYAALLNEAPIDMVCMGIGENGHIAFNDPPVANFNDPQTVKVVELDQTCRQQQVNDGCFSALEKVPKYAMTLTVPALANAKALSVVVPGATKAEAVRRTVRGPIEPACPASIIRLHKDCTLYLDRAAARLLQT